MSDAKTLFLTGGASGIGRETALLFAKRGWRVGAVDVDEVGLASLASQIGAEEGDGLCWTARLDVRDAEAYAKVLADFGAWCGGRLDALFNCAGVMTMGPFGEVPLADHRRTVEINVLGVVHGIHLALPLLRKAAPGAHVVSMCSASAVYGVPELAIYSATKFFIKGLTEALHLELERQGIAVSDLMPLFVDTPMVRNQAHRAGALETLGAKLQPKQIAEIVWKAVYRRKVHWVIGLLLKGLNFVGGLFPFLARPTMRLISRMGK